MWSQPLAILASYLTLSSAITTTQPRTNKRNNPPAQSHIIHEFPDGTWIENIAVRKNGQLLVTDLVQPNLYLIDPVISALNATSPGTATLIHDFSPESSLLGITEVNPDHFYVIVGNVSFAPPYGAGTYSVWSVDLQSYSSTANTGSAIKEVTLISGSELLNGMTTLDASQNLVIIADSIKGAIWLVNGQTGEYRLLLQEPEMAAPTGQLIGINGIKVLPHSSSSDTVSIYFSNTGALTLYLIPLSLTTLQATGPIQTITTGIAIDDFALDPESGYAYLADGTGNAIWRVPLAGGDAEIVIGGTNSTFPTPTSAALGRGWAENGKLFVSTRVGEVVEVDIDC